jgi:hypothetical protein
MDLSWRRCEREGATAAASRERPAGGGAERVAASACVGSVGLLLPVAVSWWNWTGLLRTGVGRPAGASRCHVARLLSCGFSARKPGNDEPREKYDVWSTSGWTAGIFGSLDAVYLQRMGLDKICICK